ncbi:sulfotransferase family protein [Planktosalinus lacus]|uniref:Sulfotransferase n=1 Tax=Planktosalinus lacus TaxID=1526573 RepID=A0A8J2V8F2_9FLAO|nr:sulfotransferase [Planktosalinus lacus]GGD84956.1 sulfotransferase [Planktosalinus lacus]
MKSFIWDKPIFILGNPRSGTSLLRLILHNNDRISIPPESHFFLWLEEKYGNWKDDYLHQYIEDLFNSTKFETWNISKSELIRFLESEKIQNYAHLTSLIYYFYSRNSTEQIFYWGDKNSLWKDKLERIKHYYPNALYVHIIRDGRDIACSYKNLAKKELKHKYAPKLSNKIEVIAQDWKTNIASIERFLDTIHSDNKITIYYEDLVRNLKLTTKKVLDKLNLDFMDNQLFYYKNESSNIEPLEFLNWKEKLMQPPDINNIGKFNKDLTKMDIKTFNNIAKATLEKHGYLC